MVKNQNKKFQPPIKKELQDKAKKFFEAISIICQDYDSKIKQEKSEGK